MTGHSKLALKIKTKNVAIHMLNDAIMFKALTKAKAHEKGPLQCALEFADELNHNVVISHEEKDKNFWYCSYPDMQTAIEKALAKPNSKYYEIIRTHVRRRFRADIDCDKKTVLGPDGHKVTVTPEILKIMIKNLITLIISMANELNMDGMTIPETHEMSECDGQSESDSWKHLEKISRHMMFDFTFENQKKEKNFAEAIHNRILQDQIPYLRYIKSGHIDSVFDIHPYSANQAWRCLYSKKAKDKDESRRLVPSPGCSRSIIDHFSGIYDDRALPMVRMNLEETRPQKIPSVPVDKNKSSSNDEPISNFDLSQELVKQVVEGLSGNRADSFYGWLDTIWAVFNVCHEQKFPSQFGLDLIHDFSRKSSKYDETEVNVRWNTTVYRNDGLRWPSIRSWLWKDNNRLWKWLRSKPEYSEVMSKDNKEIYQECYVPHVDRYRDVITDIKRYKERWTKDVDFSNTDVHAIRAAMNTGKGNVMTNQVISGNYKRIVVFTNRTSLTRSQIRRLNSALKKKYGSQKWRWFGDYRKPDSKEDPDLVSEEILDMHSLPPVSKKVHDFEDSDDYESDDDTEIPKEEPKSYRDINLEEFPFVVIQMESGYKLSGPPPDLIILDECESDLTQFSSPTMRRTGPCSNNFIKYLREAKKVLFLDAFMSDKTLNLIRLAFKDTGKTIVYTENEWLPENRRAVRIVSNNSKSLKSRMYEAIEAKIRLNQRVVLFTSNNKYGMAVNQRLRQEFPYKNILIYNKYTDDRVKDSHFDNVDQAWASADVVIFSPVLLAGVSFNIVDHFDCLFMFCYNLSCCVRDMWQAAGRIRKLKDGLIYYALDTFGPRPWNLPITYDGVRSQVLRHGELNKKYLSDKDMIPGEYVDPVGDFLGTLDDNDMDKPEQVDIIIQKLRKLKIIREMEKAPEWLMDIHIRNIWERYLTHNPASFETVFYDFMRLAGWEKSGTLKREDILGWENMIRREIGEKPKRIRKTFSGTETIRDYSQIKKIDEETADIITSRRNRGTASNAEKYQLEKYWFDTVIVQNPNVSEVVKARVFNRLDERFSRERLLNLWGEHTTDPVSVAEETAATNPYPEIMDNTASRLFGIKKICDLLEISSTVDESAMIPESRLEANLKDLQETVQSLQQFMELSPSTSKSKDPTRVLKLNLDQVLAAFAGTKLEGKLRRQRADDRACHYDYKIKSLSQDVKDIMNILE